MHVPLDGAGVGVEADDLRAAERRADAGARRADHHDSASDQRSCRHALAAREVRDFRVPDELPRFRVDRDHVRVRRAHVDVVAVERDAALVIRRGALREGMGVLPQQIAHARVESLELVAERERENDSVVLERHDSFEPGGNDHVHATRSCAALRGVICVSGLKPCASYVRRHRAGRPAADS